MQAWLCCFNGWVMKTFDKYHKAIKTLKKGKVITREEAKDLQMINAISGVLGMFLGKVKKPPHQDKDTITDIPFEEVK